LRVEIEAGDAFVGEIGLIDATASVRFEGWIGLMAAIDDLRWKAGDNIPTTHLPTTHQPG